MNSFPENYNVSIKVPFKDLNGTDVLPSVVRARLFDGKGQPVVDFGSLPFDPALHEKDIQVPAAFNQLAIGNFEEVRVLKVELTTASGVIRQSYRYLIQGERQLVVLENSFMTLDEAILSARRLNNIDAWNSASEESRFTALNEAYSRITNLPLKISTETVGSRYDTVEPVYTSTTYIRRDNWENMELGTFNAFPGRFLSALKTAQIIEANEILSGDEIGRRHRAGIISETIGESSVMLRGGTMDFGISTAAMRALTGYVYVGGRVGR